VRLEQFTIGVDDCGQAVEFFLGVLGLGG